MPSAAIAGVGTQFLRGTGAGSPEVFDAIAEINSINGPGMTRDQIEVTSLDSTGGYREYIGGFRDGGELTMNMNFTPGGYDDLKTDFEAAGTQNYRIILPDDSQFDFVGFVSDIPLSITPDDKITADVTIKITGAVTYTPGA